MYWSLSFWIFLKIVSGGLVGSARIRHSIIDEAFVDLDLDRVVSLLRDHRELARANESAANATSAASANLLTETFISGLYLRYWALLGLYNPVLRRFNDR